MVQDVLPGLEFCVQSYLYTKSKEKRNLLKTYKPKKPKNLKAFSKKPRFSSPGKKSSWTF